MSDLLHLSNNFLTIMARQRDALNRMNNTSKVGRTTQSSSNCRRQASPGPILRLGRVPKGTRFHRSLYRRVGLGQTSEEGAKKKVGELQERIQGIVEQ